MKNENRESMLLQFSQKTDFQNNKETKLAAETKSYILVLIGQIFFGISAFHIKLTKNSYPDEFEANKFVLYRTISYGLIAYFFLNYRKFNFVQFSEIKNKKWLYIRTFGNYIAFLNYTISMMYLRSSTAQCINNINPIFMVLMSILILNEKFHSRYIIGLVVCFIGTSIIVLNESKDSEINNTTDINKDKEEYFNILIGIISGIICLIFTALIFVASKILVDEKINYESQTIYIAGSNILLCLIYELPFLGSFTFNFGFFILSAFNGVLFYAAFYYCLEGMKNCDLTKIAPIAYMSTLTVFTLGVMFLTEPLYFSDILGSSLILGYNIYNSYKPIND